MRTNIETDDELIFRAMQASGTATKRAAVEADPRLLLPTPSQTAVRKPRGKVKWQGDLNESRTGRVSD